MPADIKILGKDKSITSKKNTNLNQDMKIYKIIILSNSDSQQLSEDEIEYLLSLKGSTINNIPLIGSYLKGNCYLDQVKCEGSLIDYTLNMEKEEVRREANIPLKVIHQYKVRCRHYVNLKLALIEYDEYCELKTMASILSLIPLGLRIKTGSQREFRYFIPSFSEIFLDEIKLQLLAIIVPEVLSVLTSNSAEEICEKVIVKNFDEKLHGVGENLKLFSCLKGKGKTVEFYCKGHQNKRNKIIIKKNGEIAVDKNLDEEIFDELVKLVNLISLKAEAVDLFCSIDGMIEEYLEFIHSNMTEESKEKHRKLIQSEIIQLIQFIHKQKGLERNLKGIYLSVIINMMIELCGFEREFSDQIAEPLEIDPIEYECLSNFLRVYLRKKYNRLLTEEKFKNGIARLANIMSKTSDEVAMIDRFNRIRS